MNIKNLGLVECRIKYADKTGNICTYDIFATPCVPHVGDSVNIQGQDCEIYDVVWYISEHWPTVDVYVSVGW